LALTGAPAKEIGNAQLHGEDAEVAAGPDGAAVTARPGAPGRAVAPPFEAPHDGDYLFEVRYTPGACAARASLRRPGGAVPSATAWAGPREGETQLLFVLARLRRGESAHLVLWATSSLPARRASFTVRGVRVSAVPAEMSLAPRP
jgi:hypothetical protein